MKKDKEKVIDEVWTEEHILSYLNVQTAEGVDPDFHILHKAYQSMRAEDFEVFINFFQKESRNINAKNTAGDTVLDIARRHAKSSKFVGILEPLS